MKKGPVQIGNGQQCFKPTQHAIRPPFFRQFDRGPGQIPSIFLQFPFEFFKQGQGIGRGPGKTRHHVILIEPADLARIGLHHRGPDRDLPVGPHGDRSVPTHAQNRGGADDHEGGLDVAGVPFFASPDRGCA